MKLAVLATVLTALAANAQQSSNIQPQVQAMNACSFLSGRWNGPGWIAFGPNQHQTFEETEDVQPKLNGLILLVQGTGKNHAGNIVHSAVAILSFDPESKNYHFLAYDATGHSVDAAANCENGAMTWSMSIGPRRMRYVITRSSQGDWHEIGEMSPDGQTWHQFFEMNLKPEHK